MTYVGRKMRRCFSWTEPNHMRPIRIVKKMLRYVDLSETDNLSECSYLVFEDSTIIDSVHEYMLVEE